MFIILLKFTAERARATQFLSRHKSWLARYFEEGVFLAAGSLEPKQGGVILAHNASPAILQKILNEDPFVKEQIVNAEILEVSVQNVCDEFQFLMLEKAQ